MVLYMVMAYTLKDITEPTRPKVYLRLSIVHNSLRHIGNQKEAHAQRSLAPDRSPDPVLQMIETVIQLLANKSHFRSNSCCGCFYFIP